MRSKLVSVADAAAHVSSGDTVVIGGSLLRRQPMALVRELVRRGVGELDIVTWAGSLAADMLAGAGALRSWEGIYVGMWWHGLAPNFRRAVEAGRVEVLDRSESYMTARLRAGAMGLPFLPVARIPGTTTRERGDTAEITCPFTGRILDAVPALEPDVTLLHGYVGDEYGNVAWPVHRDSDDEDLIMAAGSRTLVVSVERIISHEEITRSPNLTYIPHLKVTAICEAPWGAHPGSCDTVYDEDAAELQRWVDASREGRFPQYLAETSAADHDAYIAALTGARAAALEVTR